MKQLPIIYRYGILGLLLYLLIFLNKIFDKKYEARMYVIMLLVASFGQGSIASPGIPFVLILLYANKINSKFEVYN